MSTTYIAITLGPITRISSYAEDTKSLWAASYFFSYLAKELIKPFYHEKREFLKPFLEDKLWNCSDGVGMFPDQYIFKSEEGDFDKLRERSNELLSDMGKLIAEKLENDENVIIDYLKRTVKIYFFEAELEQNANVVAICTAYLNAMECQDNYAMEEQRVYLSDFFKSVNPSFLTKDAFAKEEPRLFESIIECSSGDDSTETKKKDLQDEKNVDQLKPYQKYIAFVSADGDGLGQAIKYLKGDTRKLGEALFAYCQKVNPLVKEFGGQTIFQGGDDLFFFAPVYNKGRDIFYLIEKINHVFDEAMKTLPLSTTDSNPVYEAAVKRPTLSFGVSISYYKHPMFEAVELSHELLDKAKNAGRNRIVWNLRKHSGQSCTTIFNKHEKSTYQNALQLIQLGKPGKDGDLEQYLHSVTYWLMQHREMLIHILTLERIESQKSNQAKRQENMPPVILDNYMKNSFNEEPHEVNKDFFEKIKTFIRESVNEKMLKPNINKISDAERVAKAAKSAIDELHAVLRFVEFINLEKE